MKLATISNLKKYYGDRLILDKIRVRDHPCFFFAILML